MYYFVSLTNFSSTNQHQATSTSTSAVESTVIMGKINKFQKSKLLLYFELIFIINDLFHKIELNGKGEINFRFAAITSGRGDARCEVGMAAIDVKFPHLIISQISDSQTYVNTLTKIHLFNPVEVEKKNDRKSPKF